MGNVVRLDDYRSNRKELPPLAHTKACLSGAKDESCVGFYRLDHWDGDGHCRECHGIVYGVGPDDCHHEAGCPAC